LKNEASTSLKEVIIFLAWQRTQIKLAEILMISSSLNVVDFFMQDLILDQRKYSASFS